MILVTGGTGFIGGHLLERLSALDSPTRCLVRPKRRSRGLPAGVEQAAGDLLSGAGLDEAVQGVNAVIHLAGVVSALRPEDFYAGNARATLRLAQALAGRKVRLVQVSSLAAAGPSTDGVPVNEATEPHPFTHYGKSKLEAEHIVRQLVPGAVIVRPPVVYGPRDAGVFQLLKPIARGIAVAIAGGERWVSFVYVHDLIEGLLAALHAPNATGNTYFVAHPKPVSWSELANTAGRIMGRKPRIVRVPVGLARGVGYCGEIWSQLRKKPAILSREKVAEACCMYWTCDTRRAAADLGFQAKTPIDRGLAETLAWYREAGWLKY